MTVGQLTNFIERSINEGSLTEESLVHIGTEKYQTHAESYSNYCNELVICEYGDSEEEGVKTDGCR